MESIEQQIEVLQRGVAAIIPEDGLREKLEKSARTDKPLRVKLGLDPTAPDIHLGFAVVLRKLHQFQQFGHIACLIIGDFTAMIGDPTGRSKTRPQLSRAEVEANARTYEQQLYRILMPERTEIYFNSDWLGKMTFADVIQLASRYTVARTLERDDFQKRLAQNKPLGMHEILYPLCQGYDSVAIEADIEMGGTDQIFNNLVGRDLQREYGQDPQVVLAMPLLIGLDGEEKMSKSLGNYIGITEPPDQMFGKVMSLPDYLMVSYFELCTDVPMEEVRDIAIGLNNGTLHPMDVKRRLAREIVTIYHSAEAAHEADREFMRVFSARELPEDIAELDVPAAIVKNGRVWLPRLLAALGLVSSNSEGRRMILQGAVEINGVRHIDPNEEIEVATLRGAVIRVGKLRFARVK